MMLGTGAGEIATRFVVNCAGLHSDRVTALSGQRPEVKIVPFRGDYYELTEDAHHFVKNLIYPVPDPAFPFLGVHFTRRISGSVECGPNAVLAFGREAYRKASVNPRDLFDSLVSSEPSLVDEAPEALPRASALVSMREVDATVTSVPPLKLRATVAIVSSVTMLSDTDAPTAVPSPAASPLVVV